MEETATFVAKFVGPILFVVGLGLVLNPSVYREIGKEVLRSPALTYTSGLLSLAGGLGIVVNHNIWTYKGWLLILTMTGWLLILRGLLRILIPQQTSDAVTKLVDRRPWIIPLAGVLLGFFGGVEIWHGYIALGD
jgi:uncharacterized protein YjeT (DUF2065 family)